jgi:hypothetical protein
VAARGYSTWPQSHFDLLGALFAAQPEFWMDPASTTPRLLEELAVSPKAKVLKIVSTSNRDRYSSAGIWLALT